MSELMHTRRTFLRGVGIGAGGVVVAAYFPGCGHTRRGAPGDLVPNAFLRVTPDDRVIFTLARVEMGQGVMTSETMLVAEELNLDPAEIEIEHAPNDPAYAHPDYRVQNTGGSTSTKSSFEPLRRAGATMREALLGAAGAEWGVPKSELQLEGKLVRHAKSGREIRIGRLAERAREFVDDDAEPKPRAEWRILGKPRRRLDAQAKVDGSAIFGADPEPPGVEVAVVIRGPFGSTLESFDAAEAQKMPGVKAIFAISTGVAIVADRYPRARKAAAAVRASWTKSEVSTKKVFADYAALLEQDEGSSARDDGDADEVLKNSEKIVEATYRFPYLAHAAMEPMTATIRVEEDRCEIWAPTQSTTLCANVASRVTGVSSGNTVVHQTLLGGAFGRKTYGDTVREAAEIAMRRSPAPVRLMYSREDDMKNDLYRPASLHHVRGAVAGGRPVAWSHRLIAQSSLFTEETRPLLEEIVPRMFTGAALWGARTFATDSSVVEGARNLPYAIENVKVTYHVGETPVPAGIWRSVGHSFNAFIAETFIDELAAAAAKDPCAFRRDLLAAHPRHLGVLDLAMKKAGWGDKPPPGRARGVAVHESFKSYAAIIAEVSIEDGRPRVHRVVAAVDVGIAINPDGIRAQVEGGIVWGLSAALTKEEITIENGLVEQSNFHDFEVLRMHECPAIEVHIVDSDEPPTGIGEVSVAPAAPAVANALFQLTRKRIHELPIRLEP